MEKTQQKYTEDCRRCFSISNRGIMKSLNQQPIQKKLIRYKRVTFDSVPKVYILDDLNEDRTSFWMNAAADSIRFDRRIVKTGLVLESVLKKKLKIIKMRES